MKKYKNVYVFLGRTLLYFLIVLGLLYFFSYHSQGQGTFIYNEF
ncbi:teichoic acid D-Ala incorporation-associated protein DltX [Streptococcus peroris]|nr:teichoic acid D-Ala incorporation-associated protein DltX [Streptococcus peroris]MDU7074360.1 teichoic acid D-Ala incorporation-associated protein DltX [Streptococcus peroris]